MWEEACRSSKGIGSDLCLFSSSCVVGSWWEVLYCENRFVGDQVFLYILGLGGSCKSSNQKAWITSLDENQRCKMCIIGENLVEQHLLGMIVNHQRIAGWATPFDKTQTQGMACGSPNEYIYEHLLFVYIGGVSLYEDKSRQSKTLTNPQIDHVMVLGCHEHWAVVGIIILHGLG
jgi:hypothetical protein